MSQQIIQAINCLKRGKLIAYPTEAVYGLGCDPFNQQSVLHLLSLKQRSIQKGLILVAANWQQINDLIAPILPSVLLPVKLSWPGPTTWVFPASKEVPLWIKGNHDSVALRLSDHPVVRALCEQFGRPIVSTSANREGQPPARDARTVEMIFGKELDYIVKEAIGSLLRPTEIRDVLSGDLLRE